MGIQAKNWALGQEVPGGSVTLVKQIAAQLKYATEQTPWLGF